MRVRPLAPLVLAATAVLAAGASAAASSRPQIARSALSQPRIVLASALPMVVREGQLVTVRGHVRGLITIPPPCEGVCIPVVLLQGRRTYGSPSGAPWETLARTRWKNQHGRFALVWRVSRKLGTGPLSLQVALVWPPAPPSRRTLAVTGTKTSWIGPAPVYCAAPAPPTDVPAGDGWITGGDYIEGGPYPGIYDCESQAYTITATDQGGSVAATQRIAAGASYTLVLPAGHYSLRASSCGLGSATVTAGEPVHADIVCPVP